LNFDFKLTKKGKLCEVGTSQAANQQPMEQLNQVMENETNMVNHAMNWYFAIILLGVCGLCFLAICAGIWLLRNSKQKVQSQRYNPYSSLEESHHRKSSQKAADEKPANEKQSRHEAKHDKDEAQFGDQKYLPANHRGSS
jgi:hypothetical protein